MPKSKTAGTPPAAGSEMTPLVAAALAGVIYQARLANRQMKLNIPESEVVAEVLGLWKTVMEELAGGAK